MASERLKKFKGLGFVLQKNKESKSGVWAEFYEKLKQFQY